MFRAIGITFERLSAAEVKFLGCRLTMGPLACAERRRSMVEQTRDVKDFLLRSGHDSYPIQQNAAMHNHIVRHSESFKLYMTISSLGDRLTTQI